MLEKLFLLLMERTMTMGVTIFASIAASWVRRSGVGAPTVTHWSSPVHVYCT